MREELKKIKKGAKRLRKQQQERIVGVSSQ